jgi:hypothetical protein
LEGTRCSEKMFLAIDDESGCRDLSLTQTATFMAREAKDQWKYIDALGEFLDQEVKVNDCLFKNEPILPEKLSAFLGPRMGFNCSYYVKRILKYSGADPCCAIVALIYLDRFHSKPALNFQDPAAPAPSLADDVDQVPGGYLLPQLSMVRIAESHVNPMRCCC